MTLDLKGKLQYGVVPAMATPLQDDGYHVNERGLEQLIEFLIAAGVPGLFIGGTTGEGILLDTAERRRLHRRSIEIVNGRVLTLVHVGANRTDITVELATHAAKAGADAIVAVSPHFYPLDDDAQLDYYRAIASAAPETPLFIYDIPQMAVNGISPSLLARAAEAIPTLAGVKSSRPDVQIVRQLIDAAPPHLTILAGNERVALGLLALGADGLITGLATAVPEPFIAMTAAFGRGDMAEAHRQQHLINRLLDLLPDGARIGAMKVILAQRGIAAGPPVPPRPMPPADWRGWPKIEQLLSATGR